jgi:hypothetical protein
MVVTLNGCYDVWRMTLVWDFFLVVWYVEMIYDNEFLVKVWCGMCEVSCLGSDGGAL